MSTVWPGLRFFWSGLTTAVWPGLGSTTGPGPVRLSARLGPSLGWVFLGPAGSLGLAGPTVRPSFGPGLGQSLGPTGPGSGSIIINWVNNTGSLLATIGPIILGCPLAQYWAWVRLGLVRPSTTGPSMGQSFTQQLTIQQ